MVFFINLNNINFQCLYQLIISDFIIATVFFGIGRLSTAACKHVHCTKWQLCPCLSSSVLSCSFGFISRKRKSSGSRQQCTDLGDEILWADRKGPLLRRSLAARQRTEHCWQRANENKLIQWRLWLCVPPSLLLSLCGYVCARKCAGNSWHSLKPLLKTWWHRTGNWDIWILGRPFDLASHCLCPSSSASASSLPPFLCSSLPAHIAHLQ